MEAQRLFVLVAVGIGIGFGMGSLSVDISIAMPIPGFRDIVFIFEKHTDSNLETLHEK